MRAGSNSNHSSKKWAALLRHAALCGVSFALCLTGCDQKPGLPKTPTPTPSPTATPAPTPTPRPTPEPTPTPIPAPTPEPTPYVPQKTLNVGSIFNGIHFKTKLETVQGRTATAERNTSESYSVEVSVKVTVPKPHRNIEELSKLNANIATLLPGLTEMLGSAKVSPDYDDFYRRKVTSIRSNLDRLDQLISRHNFFDCETILELTNPKTKRKALLVQADMDVDTDGADGDRMPTFDTSSRTYQPMTTYRWKKRTPTPNPCVPIWEKRIGDNDLKIKDPKNAADLQRLKSENARLRAEVADMKAHSFLIGSLDPFIVLPGQMVSGRRGGFTPRIGDYCLVLAGDVFYPAIIGDSGPTTKIGEASLRLCREINPKSNGDVRAVNDLKATYIVFPGTGEKETGPPNLLLWQTRCAALLDELGEHTGKFFMWQQPPPPPPPPTPTPAPASVAPANPAAPAPAAQPIIGSPPPAAPKP